MNQETLVNTYVLCLSEHAPGDTDGVLSMWRSYASQGHGLAIVFNTRSVPDPPQAPLRIAKVIYGSTQQRLKILQDGLVEWVKVTKFLNLPDNQLYLASYGAFFFIPNLKFKIAPVLGGSPGSLSLASLVEFILLGPSISSPIAQAAFRRVLKDTCLKDFEDRVFASTIPLRPTVG